MKDLIERLREAKEGSADLDKEIALAAYPNPQGNWVMRPYSTSIDAALTMLGEGWEYEITTLYGVAHVELPLNANDIDPQIGRRVDGNVPLALCEAIMKAREVQE